MSTAKTKMSRRGEPLVQRFSNWERIEHVLGVVTFAALAGTGVPQRYGDTELGLWIINMFGGLENTHLIHRIAGFVFVAHATLHISMIVVAILWQRGRLEMLPTPRDVKDAWNNMAYFSGRRKNPPDLPKYDYRQKFEYVGLLLGGLLMFFSGLVLVFPVFVTEYLPGQLVAASREAHSNEAVLALLVLLIWHIYSTVFAPEVFPLDTSVFTGYMPVEELHHHHAREYKRLFPEEAAAHAADHGSDGHGSDGHGAPSTPTGHG